MPKRISPEEANDLLQQGYTYVDVRSEAEFEACHPAGAVNIPFMHRSAAGMTPNPLFIEAFETAFPPESKIVLGCAGGNRSLKAAQLLEATGREDLVECRTGFGGARDAAGQVIEKGWQDSGLPCEVGQPPQRSWEAVRSKLPSR
ncbi:rhodanese-like domain-containing protein [Vulgatibacter incomptus]|uniref:Rhodanese domain-containing protein n=1 Tax=Vulgatibacter incomptus TaxID=1391653 RepID=A0A0K1PFE5_9BACT|nr:rhodanese-like domain-containing protein [Vulgatibacter incomptus]AKU92222.1 hypothetical protein AKJ08_2609 [Vulgatibacter incomptus]